MPAPLLQAESPSCAERHRGRGIAARAVAWAFCKSLIWRTTDASAQIQRLTEPLNPSSITALEGMRRRTRPEQARLREHLVIGPQATVQVVENPNRDALAQEHHEMENQVAGGTRE